VTTAYEYDPLGNLRYDAAGWHRCHHLVDGLNHASAEGERTSFKVCSIAIAAPGRRVDGAGAVVSRFVYAGGTVPSYLIQGASSEIITDQLGSVRLVVNAASGAIVQRIDYDSFGNVLLDTNPLPAIRSRVALRSHDEAGPLRDATTIRDGRWIADLLGFAGNDHNLYRQATTRSTCSILPGWRLWTPSPDSSNR
jgi:hypothetical protein